MIDNHKRVCSCEIGDRFGRWAVIAKTENNRFVVARCDCGTERKVVVYALKDGSSPSCGCRRKENGRRRFFVHGQSFTLLHHVWISMNQRCANPRNPRYPCYGGRGISVCDEWRHDFISFRDWALTHGYGPKLQIDRVNNNGNYEPANCRFVTLLQNVRNSGYARLSEEKARQIRSEWGALSGPVLAKKYGVSVSAIHAVVRNRTWKEVA